MMHVEACFCAEVSPLETATRLVVVMHRRELHKPSNSGRLALMLMQNSALEIRGGDPPDLAKHASTERRTLLLFPRDDARILTPELLAEDPRPVTLFVPDGTWSQARRAVNREPVLAAAEAVLPPPGAPTRYLLRKEHVDGGLGTGEAIARALRILEGDATADALERLFDLLVERTFSTYSGGKGAGGRAPSDAEPANEPDAAASTPTGDSD